METDNLRFVGVYWVEFFKRKSFTQSQRTDANLRAAHRSTSPEALADFNNLTRQQRKDLIRLGLEFSRAINLFSTVRDERKPVYKKEAYDIYLHIIDLC